MKLPMVTAVASDVPDIEMVDADNEAQITGDGMHEARNMGLAEGYEHARHKKYKESKKEKQRVFPSGFQIMWQGAKPSPMVLEVNEREYSETSGYGKVCAQPDNVSRLLLTVYNAVQYLARDGS